MKKITVLVLVFITFFNQVLADSWTISSEQKNIKSDNSNFLWMKKSSSARILDNFKERQQELLFENVPISSDDEALIFDSDSKIRNLEEILKRVEDRKNSLKETKRNITRKKFDLKTTLKQIDESIEETEASIKTKEEEISTKNIYITKYSEKIQEIDLKIVENRKTILKYLEYIYSKWEWMYWEDNNIDVIRSIILNDWNLWDLINDIHFKTLIELSWYNLIEQNRDLIKEYYYNKEELKKEKKELLKLRQELTSRKNDLVSQKDYKQDLLEKTKWQESIYNKLISQRWERESEIREKIENININYADIFSNIWKKYECDIKFGTWWELEISDFSENESSKCVEIKKYFLLEKKLRESSDLGDNTKNPFLWPANPTRWISTYFHDDWYFASLWSEHEAIDIRYYQWTELIAPADWYVYFINPPVSWWYWYIALKHANWFLTVYWHISESLVNAFDFVSAGQVFAKSWWAPGTPWAWPMTSWPHLHFEVYKDRESVDPLRFLDLTYLKYDNLTLKYKYKYIEDLKLKYGNKINMDRFKKIFIVGWTEIERQKYLLNKYASKDFNNWDMWVEEWVSGNIDPSFLICVWLAESWLWKHLKTWYNVWNIWNTDSWWTYAFDSPREWVYRMVKTLNNKYLRKYQTIDKLSRWWNKDWSIYASSSKNWHNNVVKCLSSLKWEFVEDDFEFRTN